MKKKKRPGSERFYVIARAAGDAAIRLLRCGITAQIKNQTNPSDKSFHNEF